ncbi:MAG TPA: metallophosphoesterase [Bacteroidia bacterium]|jgi:predicted phosphohydrolase
MRKFIGCILFFFFSFGLSAQTAAPFAVYLVGDAGEDTIPGKALLLLKDELLAHPYSAVIFLGDNVYPSGLKKGDRLSALRLNSQLQLLNEYKGKVYFIPGNHDWNAQKRTGRQVLKNQEEYVNDYIKNKTSAANKDAAVFLPKDGLPGPETVMLKEKLRLIIIDTQWFLQFYAKNKIVTNKNTKKIFYKRLDSLLAYASINNEQVIIAAHHPIFTNGQHGRRKQPLRFIVNRSPFQLFGLLGVNRLYSQDIAQPRYKKMRKHLLDILNRYDNIMFASGHDHNLQCFKEGKNNYIVSGSGSKTSHLLRFGMFKSVFQDDSKTGFIKVVYHDDGNKSTIIFRDGEQEKVLPGY